MFCQIVLLFVIIATTSAAKERWFSQIKDFKLDGFVPHHDISYNTKDYMGAHDKQTMLKLMEQVMKESDIRMRQILDIRKNHQDTIAFNVGLIIGKLRHHYRVMLDDYREAVDLRTERIFYKPSGIRYKYFQHLFHYQEYIHRHELIIDNYIRLLEEIPGDEFNAMHIFVSEKVVTAKSGTGGRRARLSDQASVDKYVTEERYKQQMREKFLLRRLGMPTNMSTPKKRFLNKWPVRQTWEENFEKMY